MRHLYNVACHVLHRPMHINVTSNITELLLIRYIIVFVNIH